MQSPTDRVVYMGSSNVRTSDMLYNSSIIDDRYRHTYRLSNNPDFRNNYAPIDIMMRDSISTRNIHPVARYLDTSVPYYHDMLYNDKALYNIAGKTNKKARDIDIDIVKLDSKPSSIDRNTVTSAPVYPKLRKIDHMKNNEDHIKNIMFVQSGVRDIMRQNRRQIAELKNSYPSDTEALAIPKSIQENYAGPLVGSGRDEVNYMCPRSSGCYKDQKEPYESVIDRGEPTSNPSLIGTGRNDTNYVCARSSGCIPYKEGYTDAIMDRMNYAKPQGIIGTGRNMNQMFMPTFTTSSNKEGYRRENSDDTYIDQVYIQALEARAKAVCDYVRTNKTYAPWKKAWAKMNKSLSHAGFMFSRLKDTDADIAYTINKGEVTRFRIRGKNYSYIPINISQYVLYHEMAHAANDKFGHGREFCEKLSILCLAAYELGFINLKNIKKEIYLTNEQPILCQSDMKGEIRRGIELVIEANPGLTSHYTEFARYIDKL